MLIEFLQLTISSLLVSESLLKIVLLEPVV